MKINDLITNWLNNKVGFDLNTPLSLVDFSASQVDSTLKALGYEQDDIESNGWQHDFWIYYTSKEESLPPLMVSGCWWDGTMQIRVRT